MAPTGSAAPVYFAMVKIMKRDSDEKKKSAAEWKRYLLSPSESALAVPIHSPREWRKRKRWAAETASALYMGTLNRPARVRRGRRPLDDYFCEHVPDLLSPEHRLLHAIFGVEPVSSRPGHAGALRGPSSPKSVPEWPRIPDCSLFDAPAGSLCGDPKMVKQVEGAGRKGRA